MKIGVYVCECGTNIGGVVDVSKVAEYASTLPKVVVSRDYKYMCSDPGQRLIKEDIDQYGLDKVVVASCSPRMHEPTFKAVVEEQGLNPYCLEMANIREQCSWVHDDKLQATDKAKALVKSAVYKAAELEPLSRSKVEVTSKALVLGGGIAGIQTAMDIADHGYKTYLVEKTPSIGGHMAQLDKTFPTLDCSACILTPKMVDVARHPNIELMTYSEVTDIDGYIGNFKVKVRKKPRYVDIEKCTGCGDCFDKCPVEIPNEFDEDLATRKAIYVPFPQAVPQKCTIDKIGVSPCVDACPAGVNVQGYIALIREGKYLEAADLIREKTPLPGVCGRICTHVCEENCNRSDIDEPVSIRALKRFAVDYEREHGREEKEKSEKELKETRGGGRKVAIVGSGPAGLTVAYDLANMGYQPTIFEALSEPGGMLRVGVPKFRLPRDVLDYDIKVIEEAGVEIETNTPIGPDLKLNDLSKAGYKAICIAIGAHKSKRLNIEGEDLEGVIQAVDYLHKLGIGEEVDFEGKVVAVIGGGNVAIDSVRTAVRLGAKSAFVIYRRTRDEMPANKEDVVECEKEGISFHYLATPKRFLGKEGKITKIECQRMKLGEPDESGRRRPIPVEGSSFTLHADIVIPAIGQEVDHKLLKAADGAMATKQGLLQVNEVTMETNVPRIFAAGDVVTGPGLVIEAIAQGHEAAISIDRYLNGEDLLKGRGKEEKTVAPVPEREIEEQPRVQPSTVPVEERIRSFDEVELRLTEEQAIKEAKRCLDCNGCSICKQCVEVCEAEAINHEMKEEIEELEVGAIVIATGFDSFDPQEMPKYGYNGRNVITGLEFERLVNASGPTGGKIKINGAEPQRVVFIQCVGSRDPEANPYCSRVCCMYTAKHAHLVREKVPDAKLTTYYTDMRAFGKGYEEFYKRVEEEGLEYWRRDLDEEIEIIPDQDKVTVKAEGYDDLTADLVVLATAITPSKDAQNIARIANISQGGDGFFLEAHPKLRPVDTLTEGIFLAGCAQGPKDIPDTVAQASGAAIKVCDILSKDELEIEGTIAKVQEEQCRGCGTCVKACPFDAIELKEISKNGRMDFVAEVNEAKCEGCGICSAACLNGAIQPLGFKDGQILAQIDALGGG